jgi:uncharacterized membrane protein
MIDENKLERLIGHVLRAGTLGAATALSVGLLLSALAPRTSAAHALMLTGLIILLVTPATRVTVSFIDYLWDRNWWFALWTGIVLALLVSGSLTAFL